LSTQSAAPSFCLRCAETAPPPLKCPCKLPVVSGPDRKKFATAIPAIALIGTPAFAADMPVKAPPPSPAPVYNWTGWYVGVNAGGSFGNVKNDFNVAPGTATSLQGTSLGTATIPGVARADRTYPSGFMGGGQIGYNWQFSPLWVVGLEADFQGADEKEHSGPFTSNFSVPLIISPGVPFGDIATGTTVLNYTTKIEWFWHSAF